MQLLSESTFLKNGDFSKDATLPIQKRLFEYVQKYSVYDDIAIVDTKGRVVARLDDSVKVDVCHSNAFMQALNEESFVEFDLPIDIFHAKKSL